MGEDSVNQGKRGGERGETPSCPNSQVGPSLPLLPSGSGTLCFPSLSFPIGEEREKRARETNEGLKDVRLASEEEEKRRGGKSYGGWRAEEGKDNSLFSPQPSFFSAVHFRLLFPSFP